MNPATVLDFITLFFAGILTGALFVIDYGVRASFVVLDEQSQIRLRQALIRRLRVLVPSIFIPTLLSAVAIAVLDGVDPGFGFRWAGLLVVLTSFALTLLGTAPINKAALTWQPSTPPKNWQTLVSRWERLDRARTWAAVIAFALFLTATALKLAVH
jgi:uncharacterized membrane protein